MSDRVIPLPVSARPGTAARGGGWVGPWLVVAACCFNMGLCFVNTRGWMVAGTAQVAALSLLILGLGAVAVRKQVDAGLLGFAALVGLAVAALALVNPGLDLKILFDLAIPPVFVLLGRQSSVAAADRVVRGLVALVVAVGLVEIWLTDLFQQQLDILSFYTNKGMIDPGATNYNGNQFFTSAERTGEGGRGMLPFLFGPHRVSSIFLEPISMGNFPIICLAWLLSVPARWTVGRAVLLGGVLLCIVLPDSRYAAASCGMLVALRLFPWRTSPLLAAALPLGTLAGLVGLGVLTLGPTEAPNLLNDDFAGRLTYSGKLLASWHWFDWLNVDPTPMYTSDTGYAYLIKGVGLPVALLLVARFAARPLSRTPGTMRGMVALYAATALCVGGSFFSIKTAGLLWFLYGVSQTRA